MFTDESDFCLFFQSKSVHRSTIFVREIIPPWPLKDLEVKNVRMVC